MQRWGRNVVRLVVAFVCGALVVAGLPATAAAGTPSASAGVNPLVAGWNSAWGAGSSLLSTIGSALGGTGDDGPARAAAAAPDKEPPTRVKELVGQRTETASVYEMSDGRYQAEISRGPAHFKDEDGAFQKIDPSVVASDREGFEYGNSTNVFRSDFSERSDRLVRFEAGDRWLTMGLPGEGRSLDASVDGDVVTYEDVFGTADLRYQVTNEALKEEIVLEEPPDEDTEFTFIVRMGGVTAREQADGSIGFFATGREGPAVFEIPRPFMYDSAQDDASITGTGWSDEVTQSVSQRGSNIEITVSADPEWLAAEEREYPVVIDPTIKLVPNPDSAQDAMVLETSPGSNYGEDTRLSVGTVNTGRVRSLLKFDLSSIPDGVLLDSASLRTYFDHTHTTNSYDVTIGAYRVTQPWAESTVTWTSQPSASSSASGTDVKTAGQSSAWHEFSVTPLAQTWLDDPASNHGMLLRATSETLGRGGPRYQASQYGFGGETSNRPALVLTWGQPGVVLDEPAKTFSTGAVLNWSEYGGGDIAEYQVHRSLDPVFAPTAATLVAPVPAGVTSFTDTTAEPTPADDPDPFGSYYYYMVAVKTTDGELIPASTQIARLPKAGLVREVYQASSGDATLSKSKPTTNLDTIGSDAWNMVGNNSPTYGISRTVLEFPGVEDLPEDAMVVGGSLEMWAAHAYGSGASFDVHTLNRGFTAGDVTWNLATSGTAWSSPGGDYDPAAAATVAAIPDEPYWHRWAVADEVQEWVSGVKPNHGFLFKLSDEAGPAQRVLFLSSEAAEPALHPKLVVTYVEPTAESTYYAPETPKTTLAGEERTVPVTITNTSPATWSAADHALSYHWAAADGTDVTSSANRLETPLPADVAPGESVTVQAAVKSPELGEPTNKREEFTLSWDVRNTASGQWMSDLRNIPALDQSASVANPTSNQLGLEKFYQYTGTSTGAGSSVLNNLFAGNTVWSYDAFSNPSTGVSTFARMTYNSLDTSASSMGFGWSLTGSSLMRLGTPLDFHPRGQDWPSQVTLTDGDGTAHLYVLNKNGSSDEADWTYDNPAGVHLYLQKTDGEDPTRAWVFTSPDRTQFFFDTDGYQSALVDRNGNELLFTYENRKSQNKPIKFLRYVTDPDGRQTLTVEYYAKGDDYSFVDDTGAVQSGSNLTNPKIIDQVKSLTDISGRTVELVYTEEGLLGQLTDGAGDDEAKVFAFAYDMTQGMKNVKLVSVTDPRGNTTELSYYEAPTDPKAKWLTETITDRAGGVTGFDYVDPDGSGGDVVETTVTDAEGNATFYRMDGYGRPVVSTNAKNETTTLSWDADHNVVELAEDNGATTTWSYDPGTGYPLEITDAEANANGTAGTVLDYEHALDGHVADLVGKTSPEGRAWSFGYDNVGNLTSVTDPAGTATAEEGDYETTYTYTAAGLLETATDANGNTTTYSGFGATGYPDTITDAAGESTEFVYDERGLVTDVTDAAEKISSFSYDVFGRLLETQVPKDQANDVFVVTPAPTYDPNDNITVATAPNGAVTTYVYDPADRMTSTSLPKDTETDPERTSGFEYDLVGNLVAQTEPNGTLTTSNPDDFVTRYGYDSVYQLIEVTNADGEKLTYGYDSVGNVVEVTDPRKNNTADPDDVTMRSVYDANHRVTSTIDAAGETSSTEYDLDGLVVESTDKQGSTTEVDYDPRGLVSEVRVPHDDSSGSVEYRTTRYEYDEAGNRVRVITPRGVETPGVADDFVHETVYDELNRVIEQIYPFDPADPGFATPDKAIYAYDKVGNLTEVSAPPSDGQSVRNVSRYEYFDNGWVERSVDAWDIATAYDYNELGQQVQRTLTSSGGASERAMTWSYYPDGKLAGRGDDGVPVGEHVVLVDNSDTGNVTTTGTWTAAESGSGYQGFDYATHPADTGDDAVAWRAHIPADGDYEVFVRYPTGVSGAATAAPYQIAHDGGTADVSVDQSTGGGQWVSLGSYGFSKNGDHEITLGVTGTGTVAADAVMLVRDATGEVDAEAKDITYGYDANGNLTSITDDSSGAQVDAYEIAYSGLNQVEQVDELNDSQVVNSTSFTYDPNGNPLTTTHDDAFAEYAYDVRDLVDQVTNADTAGDPEPKLTEYSYTPNGRTATEAKANGNTVTFDYYLDGLLEHQLETKADGTTVVSEHTVAWDGNGNRVEDVSRTMDADSPGTYLDRTHTYVYDPRDRISEVTKTDTSTGATLATESYVHDAASNVIAQTIDGTTTTYAYDRNRLLTAATAGVTASYNYDPFGRLDTVTSAGEVVQSYTYDGFDRIKEHTTLDETGASESTSFTYDAMDRTTSRTDTAGETTDFSYLGLSGEVLNEEVAGEVQKSYQYSPWGKRLSQVKTNSDGAEEDGYYGYNPHTDVETVTGESGNPISTYGYTAYGKDDEAEFTGVDAPDAGTPGEEPYNVYRYSAKRFDAASGTYDMGFRDYAPGINRFLSRDMYSGALADLNLSTSPWNNNRYALTSGNPTTLVELDGHRSCAVDCQSGDAYQDPTGRIHEPTPDYSNLPAIDRPTQWTESMWVSGAFSAADSSRKSPYKWLIGDASSYTGTATSGTHAAAPTYGRHAREPKHALDSVIKWGRKLDNVIVRGGVKSIPFVSAGVSAWNNFQEDQSVGRSVVETTAEAAFGLGTGVVVGGICVATALVGCGFAIAGGAALTGWLADDFGELAGDVGSWTADTVSSAYEGSAVQDVWDSTLGGLFNRD